MHPSQGKVGDMRKAVSYWIKVGGRARKGASEFANDWQWVYGTPALAAVLWLLGKSFGGADMTLPQDAFGAFLAALFAFALTWTVKFAIELVTIPAKMDQEWRDRLERKNSAIRDMINVKDAISRLIQLRNEVIEIYYREFNDNADERAKWKFALSDANERVETELEEYWPESNLIEFRSAMGTAMVYPRAIDKGTDNSDISRVMRLYTEKIIIINRIIDYGPVILMSSRDRLAAALRACEETH
jgi:hypothetical protein